MPEKKKKHSRDGEEGETLYRRCYTSFQPPSSTTTADYNRNPNFNSTTKPSDQTIVYISNLDYTLTNSDLRTIFSSFGKVAKATVVKDRVARRSRGVVSFVSRDDASKAAREMNGKIFNVAKLIASIDSRKKKKKKFGVEDGHLNPKLLPPSSHSNLNTSKQKVLLCYDIFEHILLFLPVKSLLRFKSVCTRVYELITSDAFVKLHLNYSNLSKVSKQIHWKHNQVHPSSISVATVYYKPFYQIKVDDVCNNIVPPTEHYILGSCNGLLLVAIEKDSFFWNPSTREQVKLLPRGDWVLNLSNPCPHKYIIVGLGYDTSSDEYKGVLYIIDALDNMRRLFVCTSKTGKWKETACSLDFPYRLSGSRRGATLNGYPHWIIQNYNCDVTWDRLMLMRFDIANEKFEIFSTPIRVFDDHNSDATLGVLGGCLCATLRDYGYVTLSIWVMKDYGKNDSWSKLFVFCESWIFGCSLNPLFINNNPEIVFMDCLGNVLIYNPKTRKIKFPTMNTGRLSSDGFRYVDYVESLVSPRVDGSTKIHARNELSQGPSCNNDKTGALEVRRQNAHPWKLDQSGHINKTRPHQDKTRPERDEDNSHDRKLDQTH